MLAAAEDAEDGNRNVAEESLGPKRRRVSKKGRPGAETPMIGIQSVQLRNG